MARRKPSVGNKTLKGHSAEGMLRALILHRQGLSIRKAAKQCKVMYSTLNRYIKKYATISIEELKNQRLMPNYKVNQIFTVQQEAELTAFIKESAKRKALSTIEVRKAAYEMAAVNDIETPENWKREEMAGVEWLRSFKLRNFGPEKPEEPAVNVSAIEEVMKELVDNKKVCSSDKKLSTLRDKDETMAMSDSNLESEDSNSNVLTETLEKNPIESLTNNREMAEVHTTGAAGDQDKTCEINVENEIESESSDESRSLDHTNVSDVMLDLEVCEAGAKAIDQEKTCKINVEDEIESESSDESRSLDPLSDKEDAEDGASTNVWSYYERETGARARCVVCRAVVARSDLKVHLKVNHPKLVAEADLGSDDDASDSQEDVYTEIVYLEEEQNAKKHKKSPPKSKLKPDPYIERPEPRKRQVSSSSDEVPLKRKKIKTDDKQPENNDEIEQFGKYVTCLLKKMPAAACMELQAEIINLIMKKQLELKRNETSVLKGEKMAETAGGSGSRAEFDSTASTSSFNISNGATE